MLSLIRLGLTVSMLWPLATNSWAHPHISRQQAAEQIDDIRESLERLEKGHNGAPPKQHHEAERWRDLQLRLAECHLLLGDPAQAQSICDSMVEIWPDHADIFSLRRAARLELGDIAGADTDTQRYLELAAGTPWLVIEQINRPLPPDDPKAAMASQILRYELAQRGLKRWPQNAALARRAIQLAVATNNPIKPLSDTLLRAGTDTVRAALVEEICRLVPNQARDLLVEHLQQLPAPQLKDTPSRLHLALAARRGNLPDISQSLAMPALKRVEIALSTEGLGQTRKLALRADQARALAILNRWQEASTIVDRLFIEHHDQRTWFQARIACAAALGNDIQKSAALREWKAWHVDVGVEPPAQPEAWP